MPDVEAIDVPLEGEPAWVVSAPMGDASVWAVVMDDGLVQAFRVSGRTVESIEISPGRLPPGTPPLLMVKDGVASIVTVDSDEASELTHPVPLDNQQDFAFLDTDGAMQLVTDTDSVSLGINALPDARIVQDEAGRLLLLTDATSRYAHGVVGDLIEGGSVSIVEIGQGTNGASTIALPNDKVIEGIMPIWADLNGDGEREIIVTLSDAKDGAQVVAFSENGQLAASGPAVGRGGRWRHQLAVAPFGTNGELELVDVLTPHIGGIVEFYRMEGDDLRIVAQVGGFTSHVIGSRNLDMAAAGDFDGDGNVEVLLPNQSRTELGAIRRTQDGAESVWTVPLDGKLVTNVSAVEMGNGSIAVGVGMSSGKLRLWLP